MVEPLDPAQAGPDLAADILASLEGRLSRIKWPRSIDFIGQMYPLPRCCVDQVAPDSAGSMPSYAALVTAKKWPSGQVLKTHFLNGSSPIQQKIMPEPAMTPNSEKPRNVVIVSDRYAEPAAAAATSVGMTVPERALASASSWDAPWLRRSSK